MDDVVPLTMLGHDARGPYPAVVTRVERVGRFLESGGPLRVPA